MKSCFTPHALMHSLTGFGLGVLVTAIYAGRTITAVIGLIILVIGIVLDMMRKDTGDMPTPPASPMPPKGNM